MCSHLSRHGAHLYVMRIAMSIGMTVCMAADVAISRSGVAVSRGRAHGLADAGAGEAVRPWAGVLFCRGLLRLLQHRCFY